MNQIAVVNTDKIVGRKIAYHCSKAAPDFSLAFLDNEENSLAFLSYELPEIIIINFSDLNTNTDQILSTIAADPWLHYGGIVALHTTGTSQTLQDRLRHVNTIALITRAEFDFNFPRLMRILVQNRQILFQRVLQDKLLTTISGSFTIDNDPFDVKTYANLVSNYLFNAGFIDRESQERLLVALLELLVNAIEHGNCKISFEEKNRWLTEDRDIFDLMRQKSADPAVAARKVLLSYSIEPHRSRFVITDEGEGFDWRARMEKIDEKYQLAAHGRGILMANHYVSDLVYNDKGNEVTFAFTHVADEERQLPGAFDKQTEVVFEPGDIVCERGEESNFLYYIVSGSYNVVTDDTVLATLTPDDMFLGEMSFLLNNRRSAAVIAAERGVLLKISKAAFVNAIKENPHYGIFLSRLLAQRIDRQNRQLAQASNRDTKSS